jgi:hypothetical protein
VRRRGCLGLQAAPITATSSGGTCRASINLQHLDTAERHEPTEALTAWTTRLREKIARLEQEMRRLAELEAQMRASPDQQISLTDPDARSMATSGRGSRVVGYRFCRKFDLYLPILVSSRCSAAAESTA